jgi:hypothetical protein
MRALLLVTAAVAGATVGVITHTWWAPLVVGGALGVIWQIHRRAAG